MDVTPDPRMLRMLGEIEFDEWQCLAELIDNSFDAFLKQKRAGMTPGPGGWKVSIELPRKLDDEPVVVVSDSGPGMTKTELESSIKAGFSSNDSVGNLGLFGMGFNVATARLGDRTHVSTCTSEDDYWNSVDIDFQSLIESRSFTAKESVSEKTNSAEHGTRIEISRLRPERADYLSRNESKLRKRLGAVYSFLIEREGFKIEINGEEVSPARHCVWGKDRSVKLAVGGEQIEVSAVKEINFELAPVYVCLKCSERYPENSKPALCSCDSDQLILQERKIWGWLGVQRYLHTAEYGIDFLRNGRKIMTGDKSLFLWKNPNDPNARDEIEYPSELPHQGGRIVGEIHLDHVDVTYTKDRFEFKTEGWRTMVSKLRGEAPMRPLKAKQAGFIENTTPLAIFYKAFKDARPGINNLSPGDGSHGIHEKTREWGELFHEGLLDYQDDSIWWQAILDHEKKANGSPDLGESVPLPNIFDEIDNQEPSDSEEMADIKEVKVVQLSQTELASKLQELCELARSGSQKIKLADGSYSVNLFLSKKGSDLTQLIGDEPIKILFQKGNVISAYVNISNEAFSSVGFDPVQIGISRLAEHLSTRIATNQESSPLSMMVEIAKSGIGDVSLADHQVRAMGSEFFSRIAEILSEEFENDPQQVLDSLEKEDEQSLKDSYAMANSGKGPDFADSAVLRHLQPMSIARLAERSPKYLFSERVLGRTISSELSPKTQRLVRWDLLSHILNLAVFLETNNDQDWTRLRSAAASLAHLEGEISK